MQQTANIVEQMVNALEKIIHRKNQDMFCSKAFKYSVIISESHWEQFDFYFTNQLSKPYRTPNEFVTKYNQQKKANILKCAEQVKANTRRQQMT